MKLQTRVIWASLGFGAELIALFQRPPILQAQLSNPRPVAETRAVAQPQDATRVTGTLEGMVTLTCAYGAIDCIDRPYHVGLFVQVEERNIPPILVHASPKFSIPLAPGRYTISSPDTRASRCLPTPQPLAA